MSKKVPTLSHPVWFRQRERGKQIPLRYSNAFNKSLNSSISAYQSWIKEENSESVHGGVLTLDFSPDGALLVAGCARNSFLTFDPLSCKLIRTVDNAHESSVTNVKFLDSRTFATGSSDKTVCLWDTRNLKTRLRTFRGHANTIGNIDFSPKNNLLITSGLDGIIYSWDMKESVETEICRKIFESYILLRHRLIVDESKMVISTARGYLILIHDLDLNTLALDEIFGITYMKETVTKPHSIANRRRNRVEIVADFPYPNSFSVISALEVHPEGWSAICRSTCAASEEEWTSVHDIRDTEPSEDPQLQSAAGAEHRVEDGRRCGERGDEAGATGPFRAVSPPPGPSPAPSGALVPASPTRSRASSLVLEPSSFDCRDSSVAQWNPAPFSRIPRLTHCFQEKFDNERYIDNLCISADGRLICSPFISGIRLLTFLPECSEVPVPLSQSVQSRLHEFKTYVSDTEIVVCSKFSPRHSLLAIGCLGGRLGWYQPVL
ncbi:hypothetical protein R5R35_005399 [Gryllus longicercus]|uniref:Uncharacterized protein n=1 Tax=Gryllus longicercus TaxID=2509291 RepID=A0AAN9VJK5_9ORTH